METIIDDNLLNILLFLDIKNIMVCIYINKLFNRICFTNILWKKLLAKDYNMLDDCTYYCKYNVLDSICITKTLTEELTKKHCDTIDECKYYDMYKSCYKLSKWTTLKYFEKPPRQHLNYFDNYNINGGIDLHLCNSKIKWVPPEITLLCNLKNLLLCHNSLTSIPSEIGQLYNLEILKLDNNQLISIPNEIGNLTNLQTLDLSYNKLSIIPKEFGKLCKLTTLDITYNFTKEIPDEMNKINNLQIYK